jgi:CRISPR system Cascade subunit CasD
VLGLVAAALGLKHPDTVESEAGRAEWESRHAALAQGYGLAVSVQALGVSLSDYHTAQVPSSGTGRNRRTFLTRRDELTWLPRAELNTILSRREYRQDAFATCALWARENAPHMLAELRDALQEPRFVLYLGRKSCPLALPLKPELMSAEFSKMFCLASVCAESCPHCGTKPRQSG